jgi:hypothetical protein
MLSVLLFPAFFLFADDENQGSEDEIKALLYAVDDRATKYNSEITFIQEVNMNIPGGDNWLVEWYKSEENNYLLMCYAIQENKVAKDIFMGGNYDPFEVSRFDIMAEIPGKRIRDSTAVIGDYNNDGIDELFKFLLGGSGWGVNILSYNPVIGSRFGLCSVDSTIIDPENGPAPVEFITYKGMKGFKVYCHADGNHVQMPKNIINTWYAWYFYTWDEKAGEYVEVEEYIEEAEYVEAKEDQAGVSPPEPEAYEVEEDPAAAETAAVTSSRVVFFAAIATALLAAGVLLLVLVLRKRKKT